MFLHITLHMSLIKQFTEDLAIYFQCCISAPYLIYCLVFFSRKKIWTVRTFNLVIDY